MSQNPSTKQTVGKTLSSVLAPVLSELGNLLAEWDDREERNQSLLSSIQVGLSRVSSTTAQVDGRLKQWIACMESHSRQMQTLTDHHYDEHIVLPLAHRLFQLHALASETLPFWRRPSGDLQSEAVKMLETIQALVVELLAEYGVEALHAPDQSPFDPSTMEAMNSPLAQEAAQASWFVLTTHRIGFRHGQRVLRRQFVDVTIEKPQQGVLLQTP